MVRAIALAVLVALSGCSLVAGPSTPTETLTPAPVGTATPTGVPTGTPTGAGSLLSAHRAALANRSFTVTRRGRQLFRNGTLRTETTVRVEVATATRYRYAAGFTGRVDRFGTDATDGSVGRWANGTAVYRRVATGPYPAVSLVRDRRGDPVAPRAVAHGSPVGRTRLGRLLAPVTSASVVYRPEEGLYRVTISEWAGDTLVTPGGPVRNASVRAAVLRVTTDGLVRSVRVRYVGTADGHRVRGRYRTTYRDVGETTVERPVWVADAAVPPPTVTTTADDRRSPAAAWDTLKGQAIRSVGHAGDSRPHPGRHR